MVRSFLWTKKNPHEAGSKFRAKKNPHEAGFICSGRKKSPKLGCVFSGRNYPESSGRIRLALFRVGMICLALRACFDFSTDDDAAIRLHVIDSSNDGTNFGRTMSGCFSNYT